MTKPFSSPSALQSIASVLSLLYRDKQAFVSALFLLLMIVFAIFGPALFSGPASGMNLRMRNFPPFSFDAGWLYVLGGDTLGRSILARIIVASQNTMIVAAASVFISMTIGTLLGLVAGVGPSWFGQIILRGADIIMSFPSLLLAMIFLYILEPSIFNVVLVLAFTRIPVYLRTVRAEVLELRLRMFVTAARVMGASPVRVVFRHMLPLLLPTLATVAALDFAFVMLVESSLSFLGLGVQPPEVSWGVMVAEGRNYLVAAWWLSVLPGLAIMLTAVSANLLSNWLRIVLNPEQRWRLERRAVPAADAKEIRK